MSRVAALAVLLVVTAAAGCPTRGPDEGIPEHAIRLTVRPGAPATVFDGRLRVLVTDLTRGGSFARVTLMLHYEGQTAERVLTAVRQADYSDEVRLSPFAACVVGFPGVDSIRLAVWEEAGG